MSPRRISCLIATYACSLSEVLPAAVGAAAAAFGVPVAWHLALAAVVVAASPQVAVRGFLPAGRQGEGAGQENAVTGGHWRAWRERRTVLIGVMVLAMALSSPRRLSSRPRTALPRRKAMPSIRP